MFLKRSVVLIFGIAVATTAVRSQTGQASQPKQDPSPLFLSNSIERPGDLTVSRPTPALSRNGSVRPAPFALDLPKPHSTAPTAASDTERPAPVDLSALRYFAAQNDLGRVSAEIRLLRAKNPDWEPPEDLFSGVQGGPEEQPLWDLFGKHDLAGIRAKMDEIRQAKPDWQPSSDLRDKLTLAQAHDDLVAASDSSNWAHVVEIASGNKMLLTCGDLDALWRTAEALVRTGEQRQGRDAYHYTLLTCEQPEARLATVQKASLVLTAPEDLDELIVMGQRRPDGRGEFDQIHLDLLRRKIGDAASGVSATLPTDGEIAAVARNAATPDGAADAQLLGWYARSRKDFTGAQTWFRTALREAPNAKAAEGLVLAVRDGGDLDAASRLALQYADLDPANRKLMVEIQSAALSDPKSGEPAADALAALTKAVVDAKSADGAQALGWHAYRRNDLPGAEGWFHKSADWQSNEPAAIGLVVTARRLHHDADYAARIAQYRSTYPRIAELESLMRSRPVVARRTRLAREAPHGRTVRHVAAVRPHAGSTTDSSGQWDKSADDIVKLYDAGQYDTAIARLEQRRQKGTEPRGLSLIRGWALYHKGDWDSAKQVFSSVDKGPPSRDSQEGLRVIQLGYTNPRYR